MKIKKDNIHLNGRRLDSYNKPFNFFITERETGKSTWAYSKMYKKWKNTGRPSICLRRLIVDITAVWIEDVIGTINQFLDDDEKLVPEYKKGDIKEGVVDVFAKKDGEKKLFFRVIALSNPKSRIKSLILEDPAFIFFDEFIVDTASGEKYLKGEADKFSDLYKTFSRHAIKYGHQLKCYFLGNPYSVYSPYLTWLDVQLSKVKPGCFIVGKNYVIDCQHLSDELREFLLKKDPLYQFDNAFTRYLFGIAVNDERFPILGKQPFNYKLKWVYYINGRYLGIFRFNYTDDFNRYMGENAGKYWVGILPNYNGSRKIKATNFNDLIIGTQLVTFEERKSTIVLREAIGMRKVTYQTLECAYLIESIFNLL